MDLPDTSQQLTPGSQRLPVAGMLQQALQAITA